MELNQLKIWIVGISDREQVALPAQLDNRLDEVSWFAGGKRHYERVKHLLPENTRWVSVTIPLEGFYKALCRQQGTGLLFASGDPLFYGIAVTLKRTFPAIKLEVFPFFNSLQMLAHRCQLPYGEYRVVSLTGRPWDRFDEALVQQTAKIALLTDAKKTPSAIARHMLMAGFDNYEFVVGEAMGGSRETITRCPVTEAAERSFRRPNCIFLTQTHPRARQRGIPDERWKGLDGRPRMITKMPVRMTTLALMNLSEHHVLWDVGACTGSISLEAKLQEPLLNICSFEIREECAAIVSENCRRFGVPGISLYSGDFLEVDKELLPAPDLVFLGGYGGKMQEVLDEIDCQLISGGIIVFNAVSDKSSHRFLKWAKEKDYPLIAETTITVDDFHPIRILLLQKKKL